VFDRESHAWTLVVAVVKSPANWLGVLARQVELSLSTWTRPSWRLFAQKQLPKNFLTLTIASPTPARPQVILEGLMLSTLDSFCAI
jgi:hypothetical protein